MKRYCLFITLITGLLFIQPIFGQTSTGPVISFEETSYDFGDLSQGDKVNHVFEFTNTGKDPLLIANVLTTCGCTATKWTNKPVKPGKTSQVKITFDSTGKMGKQNKIITVVSNADSQYSRLSITANVLPKKKSY